MRVQGECDIVMRARWHLLHDLQTDVITYVTSQEIYHKVSNIRCIKSPHQKKKKKILVLSCSCLLCHIHWSQVFSREWRCSWSSADRRCSNYIWVISNSIAYWGVFYIRGLMVHMVHSLLLLFRFSNSFICPSAIEVLLTDMGKSH